MPPVRFTSSPVKPALRSALMARFERTPAAQWTIVTRAGSNSPMRLTTSPN